MNNTYKIYGKTLNTWTVYDEIHDLYVQVQREVAYREYYKDTHELKQIGSRDFTKYTDHEMTQAWIWSWDGVTRNAGGHRWFRCEGTVRYSSGDAKAVREHLRRKYNAAEIQLRK